MLTSVSTIAGLLRTQIATPLYHRQSHCPNTQNAQRRPPIHAAQHHRQVHPSTNSSKRKALANRAISAQAQGTGAPSSGSPGNPIGVHWLVWAGGLSEAECRKAVEGSARAGYNLVEIPLLDPSLIDAPMLRGIFDEYNIKAASSLGLRPDADISNEDSEIAARGERLLEDALEAAAGVRCSFMTGVTFSAMHKYPKPPTAQGRKNCIASLKRVAAKAADVGVTLGLEVVNRYESNLLNTATQAMEMIDDIGAPNVVVHLDSYHMHIEENGMAAAVEACGGRLGYVHIGENHRGYLGSGQVDFEDLFAALARAQYSGPITFESFSSKVVSAQLSNTLSVWRNLWDDSEDLAKSAKSFIDQHWKAALEQASAH